MPTYVPLPGRHHEHDVTRRCLAHYAPYTLFGEKPPRPLILIIAILPKLRPSGQLGHVSRSRFANRGTGGGSRR
jgi:hypothetical protein